MDRNTCAILIVGTFITSILLIYQNFDDQAPLDTPEPVLSYIEKGKGEEISTVESLNKTSSKSNFLLYNRVTTCGSSNILLLLNRLGIRNGFEFQHSSNFYQMWIPREQERKNMAAKLTANHKADHYYAYERHIFYMDFQKLGFGEVIYLNLVRDPAEREISVFYDKRAQWIWKGLPSHARPSQKWFDKNLTSCLGTADGECGFTDGSARNGMVSFFCGHQPLCRKHNNQVALQKAKLNIEKSYSVVGVLEQMEKSLHVMEEYVPRFFSGATDLYTNASLNSSNKQNVNYEKPVLDKNLYNRLKNYLSSDYELYTFIVQRLETQYLHIKHRHAHVDN